jgi:integrase
LPRIRIHDLHHSAATLLLGRGVNPKIVSEMLGHASINITRDVYSHVLPAMQAQAAAAMDDALGNGGADSSAEPASERQAKTASDESGLA